MLVVDAASKARTVDHVAMRVGEWWKCFSIFLYRYSIYYDGGIRCSAGSSIDIDIGLRSIAMNAGIAFISRKSRKTDVAWRYAIAVVLVVCCIGLAYVEIVVAPWFINEVVSMFSGDHVA